MERAGRVRVRAQPVRVSHGPWGWILNRPSARRERRGMLFCYASGLKSFPVRRTPRASVFIVTGACTAAGIKCPRCLLDTEALHRCPLNPSCASTPQAVLSRSRRAQGPRVPRKFLMSFMQSHRRDRLASCHRNGYLNFMRQLICQPHGAEMGNGNASVSRGFVWVYGLARARRWMVRLNLILCREGAVLETLEARTFN